MCLIKTIPDERLSLNQRIFPGTHRSIANQSGLIFSVFEKGAERPSTLGRS